MKKIITATVVAILASVCVLCAFFGCTTVERSRINIVCTIFPIYDWVRNIVGDTEDVGVTMLMDSGVDLHSYDPTAEDIITVGSSDLFVYVGGESDENWVDRVLAQKTNQNLTSINLMEVLAEHVREEQTPEGAEDDEEHDDGETEYDEHIWLSLKNAQVAVAKIAEELTKIDEQPSNYVKNAQTYSQALADLDLQFAEMASSAKNNTIVVGDRFPFLYLVSDYNIGYYAAFKGCAATEAAASFQTITFLAGKLDELGLNYILETEGSSNGIAKTIIAQTKSQNQTVLTLDSMQSVTAARVNAGATYLGIMQSNLQVLKTALN